MKDATKPVEGGGSYPGSYPPRVRGMNGYDCDSGLQNFLRRVDPDFLARREDLLRELGAFALGEMDEQAEESDRFFPARLDRKLIDPVNPQERRGQVVLGKRYKDAQQALYRYGTLAAVLDEDQPESNLLPFITQYMAGKTDISTGCPYAMTHPVALILKNFAPDAVRDRFLPEMKRVDGLTPIGGTWATEQHSGSNVGATQTKAIVDSRGHVVLEGLKWFTSAIGFDRFLTVATARPEQEAGRQQEQEQETGGKGLGLYLVPSHIDEDWTVANDYDVLHLKDKLGTKALPTGETSLRGTIAYEIVPPPQGLRVMMVALGCSRVHNAMSAAGVMHRAYLEAMCWADNRKPFGKKLSDEPMIQKRVLDIYTQFQAGAALAFEAARCFADVADQKPQASEEWMRVVTALAKYKTAEQALWCCEKALEIVGGNGYTEEYPTARQFRDAMVLRVWEGPEQIQALELMRMVTGKAGGDAAFVARLGEMAESLPDMMKDEKRNIQALASQIDGVFMQLRDKPDKAVWVADEILHKMADILSYALLCEQAGWEHEMNGDCSKVLTARHFYQKSFGGVQDISFQPASMHLHFNAIVRHCAISEAEMTGKRSCEGGKTPGRNPAL